MNPREYRNEIFTLQQEQRINNVRAAAANERRRERELHRCSDQQREFFFFLKTDRGPAGQSRQNSQPAATHSWNPSNFFSPRQILKPKPVWAGTEWVILQICRYLLCTVTWGCDNTSVVFSSVCEPLHITVSTPSYIVKHRPLPAANR